MILVSVGDLVAQMHPEVRRLVRSLLEIVDNLERALGVAEQDATTSGPFVEGVQRIHQQILDTLYRYEIRGFSSTGAPFDPSRHEALGQVPSDTVPPNHVVDEIRRGYLHGETLFRAAQVMVSAAGAARTSQPTGPQLGVKRPGTARRSDRSAPSRPAWLLNPPASTRETLYVMGRAAVAETLEAGEERARLSALARTIEALAARIEDSLVEHTYTKLAESIDRDKSGKVWKRVCDALPEAPNWIEDYYWEQVKGEIRGAVYDVAVLMSLTTARGDELLGSLDRRERWSGLTITDVSQLFQAVTGATSGGLIVDAQLGGLGAKAGLQQGDVIIRVGNRRTENAAAARRLLTLAGNGRRVFEVEYIRGPGRAQTLRIDPTRR